jgi:hypothetical protein
VLHTTTLKLNLPAGSFVLLIPQLAFPQVATTAALKKKT